jgi:DNA-binding beta-propeller fold protein YncE
MATGVRQRKQNMKNTSNIIKQNNIQPCMTYLHKLACSCNHNMSVFFLSMMMLLTCVAQVSAGVDTTFMYTLSDFNGPIPYNWATIRFDESSNEMYVIQPIDNNVRVFNQNGMEIYRFGEDGSLGVINDIAVRNDGNLLVISQKNMQTAILLCNYRGELLSELKIQNLSPDFAGFTPDTMIFRHGRLYLLNSQTLKIVVTDSQGRFETGYDIASLVNIDDKKRQEKQIGGFSVDSQRNMMFTIPVLFTAYTLSPDGEINSFGISGSAPGRFGVIGDIARDDSGNFYVADLLKSVVLVFDKNLEFQTEFGYRGLNPENLIGPKNLALDVDGRLYVSQLRGRGISVFQVTHY